MFSDQRHQRRVQNIGHHVCGRHNPTYVSTVSLVKLGTLVTRPSGGNRNLACRAYVCSAGQSALRVGGVAVVAWSVMERTPRCPRTEPLLIHLSVCTDFYPTKHEMTSKRLQCDGFSTNQAVTN